MTKAVPDASVAKARKRGVLLEPLGWVHDRLSTALRIQPSLFEYLFEAGHARIHLVALVLAHLETDVTPAIALMLLKGHKRQVLNLGLFCNQPFGIDRALAHLQQKVMAPDTYRRLISLLNDLVTAKFLNHAPSIKEPTITGLYDLPIALRRPPVFALLNRLDGNARFVDGLRFLATRANLPFEQLAREIGALDQLAQVTAKIRQVVDDLPLPTSLPAAEIGGLRRLDCIAEIRDLAKTWKNCLVDHIYGIDEGTSAFYLAEEKKALCFLSRYGRIGWFLQQTKGPNNIEIEPDLLSGIHNAFESVGIPQSSLIEVIKDIVLTYRWEGNDAGLFDA